MTAIQRPLPNLFIIGAPKCGTSALHFYLSQHPEISMSRVKEPHVFSNPRWMPSRGDYDGLLSWDAPWRGESSTSYTRYPAEGDAAARIYKAVPTAKLIYLVGEPVERIVSDYAQAVAVGVETRSLEDAIGDYSDRSNWYVCASRYATQISRYLALFDRASLLIIMQSDLRTKRADTLMRVFDFIGVDERFWSREFEPEVATRDDHMRYGSAAWHLRESTVGRAFRRMPARLRLPMSRAVRRRLAKPVPRPTLDSDLRTDLVEFLRDEILQFQKVTGEPLGPDFNEYLARPVTG